MPFSGTRAVAYWSEDGRERTELLGRVVEYLNDRGWGKTLDSGWSDWDLEVYCHPWTVVQVCTAQEDHGGGKRLIRVRYRLRASGYTAGLGALAALAGVLAAGLSVLPARVEAGLLLALATGPWAFCLGAWWRGTYRAARLLGLFNAMAKKMGLVRCSPCPEVGGK